MRTRAHIRMGTHTYTCTCINMNMNICKIKYGIKILTFHTKYYIIRYVEYIS
jgi:hypothetical protein